MLMREMKQQCIDVLHGKVKIVLHQDSKTQKEALQQKNGEIDEQKLLEMKQDKQDYPIEHDQLADEG